jgi:hypothetical protein
MLFQTLLTLKSFKEKSFFNKLLGDGTNSPPANLFGLASPQIPGFTLGEVPQFLPEPGTMTLAAVGAAAVFFFRRRFAV